MEFQPTMTEITKNGTAPGIADPELVERAHRRRYSAEYKLSAELESAHHPQMTYGATPPATC
jgi:hypothetical protein